MGTWGCGGWGWGLRGCRPLTPRVCYVCACVQGLSLCPGAEMGFAAWCHKEESVPSPGSPQQRAKWLQLASDTGDAAVTSNTLPRCPPLSFLLFFPFFHLCGQRRPQLRQQGQGWGQPGWGLGSSLPAHPSPALLPALCGCLCRLGEDPAQLFPPA